MAAFANRLGDGNEHGIKRLVGEAHTHDRVEGWHHARDARGRAGLHPQRAEHIQERGSWQRATELIILAAERDGSIEAATLQIEDALFLEARYVRR